MLWQALKRVCGIKKPLDNDVEISSNIRRPDARRGSFLPDSRGKSRKKRLERVIFL